jgi:hypothetical protein
MNTGPKSTQEESRSGSRVFETEAIERDHQQVTTKKSDFIPTYLEGVDDGNEGVEEDHDHYSEGCDELRGTRHTTDTTKSYTTMS